MLKVTALGLGQNPVSPIRLCSLLLPLSPLPQKEPWKPPGLGYLKPFVWNLGLAKSWEVLVQEHKITGNPETHGHLFVEKDLCVWRRKGVQPQSVFSLFSKQFNSFSSLFLLLVSLLTIRVVQA